MTIAYFDCFGGASGDMIVGALLDAGVRLEDLRAELKKLGLPGYSLDVEQVQRGALAGLKFHVHVEEHHEHEHGEGRHHHHGRNLPDILHLLDHGKLAERADRRARLIFRRLAEAEAQVHNMPVEQVHFHEVGAVDSIVDIVGACVAMELLGVETISCSPIPLGCGTVNTAHGVLPVPAPATALLMRGHPVAASDFPKELCTPTAAAILTTLAESFGPLPAMQLGGVGYGAGGRDDPGRINMLRVFIGQPEQSADASGQADTVVEMGCNLDNATGEILGATVALLLEAGALDAWTTPIYMKKSRPAVQLSVLCRPGDEEKLEAILFEQTPTLGVRRHACRRSKLSRRSVTVETPYGPVRVKVSGRDGRDCTVAPEFDDCFQAAQAHHVPVRQVMAEAAELYRRQSEG